MLTHGSEQNSRKQAVRNLPKRGTARVACMRRILNDKENVCIVWFLGHRPRGDKIRLDPSGNGGAWVGGGRQSCATGGEACVQF